MIYSCKLLEINNLLKFKTIIRIFRLSHWTRSGIPAVIQDIASEATLTGNNVYSGSPRINIKEKEKAMSINEMGFGQCNYSEEEPIQYLADASLRPEIIRPAPPLFLSPDGEDLNWLNPVDIEECLCDLEFVYEPRMCVESRASSLTEARRLMHRACKGIINNILVKIKRATSSV